MARTKIHQAQADDEAIPEHTTDDRCSVAHQVDRPCPRCHGTLNSMWLPFMEGYWCKACQICFDMLKANNV